MMRRICRPDRSTARFVGGLTRSDKGDSVNLGLYGVYPFALGVKAPLNFAVFSGVGGALLLANCESFPFSVDELVLRSGRDRHAPNHVIGCGHDEVYFCKG